MEEGEKEREDGEDWEEEKEKEEGKEDFSIEFWERHGEGCEPP